MCTLNIHVLLLRIGELKIVNKAKSRKDVENLTLSFFKGVSLSNLDKKIGFGYMLEVLGRMQL